MKNALQNWPGDCHAEVWLGRRWSAWIPLRGLTGVRPEPGVYRIRVRNSPGLLYIGESSNLVDRFSKLRRGINLARTGETGSHFAGPCVWWHEQCGGLIELSWLVAPESLGLDEAVERMGLEAEYIAAHRWQLGFSPVGNFRTRSHWFAMAQGQSTYRELA